jgi:hypothetical protein
MKPKNDPRPSESVGKRVSGSIARGIDSALVDCLAAFCRWFVVTPESIKQHKPAERGNTPPPTGGVSSLG